jgi:hypothetical protein
VHDQTTLSFAILTTAEAAEHQRDRSRGAVLMAVRRGQLKAAVEREGVERDSSRRHLFAAEPNLEP